MTHSIKQQWRKGEKMLLSTDNSLWQVLEIIKDHEGQNVLKINCLDHEYTSLLYDDRNMKKITDSDKRNSQISLSTIMLVYCL